MKRFFSFLAAATMLFAASCAEDTVGTDNGNVAQVTFNLGLEGQSGTRLIGDGKTVDRLFYSIFDAAGNQLSSYDYDKAFTNSTAPIKLAKNQTYTAVFWAQKGNAYVFDHATGKVTVTYGGAANNEARDAFFGKCEFKVTGTETFDVTLYRPFAQLNVGVSAEDWTAAVNSNVTITKSYAKITGVYNTLNLLTGKVEGDAVDAEFTMEARPDQMLGVDLNKDGEIKASDKEEFHYLSMNYVLVKKEQQPNVGVKFTFATNDTPEKTIDFELATVPVERNHRTNIIGQILTGNTDFNVTIDARFANDEFTRNIWDGSAKQPKIETVNGQEVVSITSGENLAWLAQLVNGTITRSAAGDYSDMIIRLGNDIDLNNINWTPIGTSEEGHRFNGTFDGNGHTIRNLKIVETQAKEGKAYMGFFGYAEDATIKNVVFENVNINIACLDIDHSQGHIGAVAGSLEGTSTIEKVTVKGDIKVEATPSANGASRVAVVAGGNADGNVTMKNVHVIANEGSYLKANNNVGALAGQLQVKSVFENCSSNINVTGTKFFAGGIIGLAAGDQVFTNCHTTGNITITAGRAGRANDHYRVGGIAGGWADGKTKVCTLVNCSYTGKVSGKNSDGSVAEVLDYAGYVGRGYTLANCAGSKVVIDGVEYIQKNDTDYGLYTINGVTAVKTADELIAALENKEDVLFLKDIKIEPAKMSNAYGATGINVKYGQTIDGNGYTLNIKGAGGTWDSGINTTGGLIKNLTVTGSFRGIFINHTSEYSEKVVLENVTIGGNGTVYTISCDQGLYQGIEARNCTFNGWTSFAKTAGEAKFINCSFGEGSTYKYCRPYSNTEFVNCTFCPGYYVDKTQATVTFTNCTWEE